MLNKEVALLQHDFEPHILLTVGKDGHDFGYSKNYMGKISKIPFWKSRECFLTNLYYDGTMNLNTGLSLNREDVFDISYYIDVSINGITRTFYPYYSFEDGPGGDPYGFTNNEGKTLSVRFNPPTGTFKKVKQTFISTRKEGVVNAEEGTNTAAKFFIYTEQINDRLQLYD